MSRQQKQAGVGDMPTLRPFHMNGGITTPVYYSAMQADDAWSTVDRLLRRKPTAMLYETTATVDCTNPFHAEICDGGGSHAADAGCCRRQGLPPQYISGMSVSENMGTAVEILFLTRLELQLYCMLYAVHKLYVLLPVLSRHIGYLVGARPVRFSPSCGPIS